MPQGVDSPRGWSSCTGPLAGAGGIAGAVADTTVTANIYANNAGSVTLARTDNGVCPGIAEDFVAYTFNADGTPSNRYFFISFN